MVKYRFLLLLLPLFPLWMAGCGGGEPQARRFPDLPDTGKPDLYPARPDSAYASELPACAFGYERNGNNDVSDACTMARLPLIGQEAPDVTAEDILARTLVSHDWMSERFEAVLSELPDDLTQLFQGVTAVVIGADIRPSYYWAATGAIYLDPARLWLTKAERDTISREPDYRSEYGDELAFDSLWRYVKGGHYAWQPVSLDGPDASRALDDIVGPMATLLFHELAHANDYIPPATLSSLDRDQTVLEAAVELERDNVSSQLDSTFPLSSGMMFGLADVMFHGNDPTAEQRDYDGEQVGLAFADDAANDPYAYSSVSEDTAMLFEEVMMKHHFGVDRDLAFTDRPDSDEPVCSDYVVRWGVRGRAGDPSVRPRAEFILPLLLDRDDVSNYLNSLEEPTPLTTGIGWCSNLSQPDGYRPLGLERSSQPLPESDRRLPGGHPHH